MADFSPDALKAQIDKLPSLPKQEIQIGAVVKRDAEGVDAGVAGRASVDLGQPGGWFTAAEGSIWKRAGATAAWMFGWKG